MVLVSIFGWFIVQNFLYPRGNNLILNLVCWICYLLYMDVTILFWNVDVSIYFTLIVSRNVLQLWFLFSINSFKYCFYFCNLIFLSAWFDMHFIIIQWWKFFTIQVCIYYDSLYFMYWNLSFFKKNFTHYIQVLNLWLSFLKIRIDLFINWFGVCDNFEKP